MNISDKIAVNLAEKLVTKIKDESELNILDGVLDEIEENRVRYETNGDLTVKDGVKCWLKSMH